ncbi:M23 family metallopeptidase [Sorangium sp. So ce315]|uniref:M23 family metallopeptidase n=1 Tax=Sorangium sp. So ce315 TaxID=3133299 RepID=UPI003F5FC75C
MIKDISPVILATLLLQTACVALGDEPTEEPLAAAAEALTPTGVEDRLNTCASTPDSFYRLPFSPGSSFIVNVGNWDDPGGRHDTVDGAAQSYSYDFNMPVGTKIRAARAGRVAFLRETQTANTTDSMPDPPGTRGEGNIVVIRHVDGTAAAYAHLQANQVFVTEGEYVPRGRVIALSGNTGNSFGPHLHFDVHPSFTTWDAWVPTMKIRFQDANHTCWRPQVGNTLASNNTVTSKIFSALLGPGTGVQSFLAGMETDDFIAAWLDLGASAPLLDMKDFDTYLEGGTRRYSGVFGPGSGGQAFFYGLTGAELASKRVELANATPKKVMVAFDTYLDGSTRRYSALFGPGTGTQVFTRGFTFDQFVDEWIDQGTLGRDMITFQMYLSGGELRFDGLFGPGSGGQHFVAGLEFDDFVDLWVDLGAQTPKKDMLAFRAITQGGVTRFAGLFGPGSGGQSFLAGLSYDDLASHWATAKESGARLRTTVTESE